MAAQIQAKLLTGPPFPARAIPVNDRALPHNGRDAVKISSPDGAARTLVVRGTTALGQRETGESR
jgi:hypothetical protein